MAKYWYSKRAVTLIEIIMVILITSVIMGVGMAMMSRSNRQFKKSNDLVNVQRLMDNIIERIRSDVRSLKRVKSYKPTEINFYIANGNKNLEIQYQYDPEDKTFYRREINDSSSANPSSTPAFTFHGAKQIMTMSFKPEFFDGNTDSEDDNAEKRQFKCLNVAMQIASNEYGVKNKKSDTTTLSIACQFCSTCVESELNISKLRKTSSNTR